MPIEQTGMRARSSSTTSRSCRPATSPASQIWRGRRSPARTSPSPGPRAGIHADRSGTCWPFWNLMQALGRERRAPRPVVLENVVGALTSPDGRDFAAVGSALSSMDYRFGAVVMDAVAFVPQSRPRCRWFCQISGHGDEPGQALPLAARVMPPASPPAVTAISDRQRVTKSRRCWARGIDWPRRWRARKYCRSSSNAEQKRAADAKLPKPRMGSEHCCTARWLCSVRWFQSWRHRCRTFLPRIQQIALRYGGCWSVVMRCGVRSATSTRRRRTRRAASVSRCALRLASRSTPSRSMARSRAHQRPATCTSVSSRDQARPARPRRFARRRAVTRGATRHAQARIVSGVTEQPRSSRIAALSRQLRVSRSRRSTASRTTSGGDCRSFNGVPDRSVKRRPPDRQRNRREPSDGGPCRVGVAGASQCGQIMRSAASFRRRGSAPQVSPEI